MTNTYTFPIIVKDDDIDHLAHVNNASYIKWVQSAVVAHWEHYATPALQAQNFWIALRHEIDYVKETFRHDDLVAEVILHEVKTVRATYQSVIKRGEEIVAKAISTWCCIHPDTHRPQRISPEILTAFHK